MGNQHSPDSIFRERLGQLSGQLPGVRDGSDEAIHDARVATRRLREALPLLGSPRPARDKVDRWLKRTGRALGRIRDLDVMLGLAIAAVQRLPAAAVPLQHLLVELHRLRDAGLRRAVKRLERQDRKLPMAALRIDRRTTWGAALRKPPWEPILAERILRRADSLEMAVARAGGINFPNRVHDVRIAAKKLRYALEAADATGTVHVAGAMPLLKHVQDVLGHLHDRHVFVQTVGEHAAEAGPEHGTAFDAVRAYIETECRDLHRRYLDERADLLALCVATRSAVRAPRLGLLTAVRNPAVLAAAGALALPSAVRWFRRAG